MWNLLNQVSTSVSLGVASNNGLVHLYVSILRTNHGRPTLTRTGDNGRVRRWRVNMMTEGWRKSLSQCHPWSEGGSISFPVLQGMFEGGMWNAHVPLEFKCTQKATRSLFSWVLNRVHEFDWEKREHLHRNGDRIASTMGNENETANQFWERCRGDGQFKIATVYRAAESLCNLEDEESRISGARRLKGPPTLEVEL